VRRVEFGSERSSCTSALVAQAFFLPRSPTLGQVFLVELRGRLALCQQCPVPRSVLQRWLKDTGEV
jgi:hypothetical protein